MWNNQKEGVEGTPEAGAEGHQSPTPDSAADSSAVGWGQAALGHGGGRTGGGAGRPGRNQRGETSWKTTDGFLPKVFSHR